MMPMGLVRPWKRVGRKPDGEVVIVATKLTLARSRDIPRFVRWTGRIRTQVLRSDGALGVKMLARPFRGDYYTITVWRDEAAVRGFVRTSPHREIMLHLDEITRGPGTFTSTSWSADASTVPPTWADAISHLDATGAASTTTAAV